MIFDKFIPERFFSCGTCAFEFFGASYEAVGPSNLCVWEITHVGFHRSIWRVPRLFFFQKQFKPRCNTGVSRPCAQLWVARPTKHSASLRRASFHPASVLRSQWTSSFVAGDRTEAQSVSSSLTLLHGLLCSASLCSAMKPKSYVGGEIVNSARRGRRRSFWSIGFCDQ